MNLDTLITFLTVRRTRHFGVAADELFLTQAAVSARIKKLESQLGATLFNRENRAVQLTTEGHRFVGFAERMLAEWRRAEQEVAYGEYASAQLSVSGVHSLWDYLLQNWVQTLCVAHPDLALITDVGSEEAIQMHLLSGLLDLGFVYEPPILPEILSEQVASTQLVLVSTCPDQIAQQAMDERYVYVEWGFSFDLQHARLYPDAPIPQYRMGRERVARRLIESHGGAAYLNEETAREDIDAGELFLVNDAPVIERAVYAMYLNRSPKKPLIKLALRTLQAEAEAQEVGD